MVRHKSVNKQKNNVKINCLQSDDITPALLRTNRSSCAHHAFIVFFALMSMLRSRSTSVHHSPMSLNMVKRSDTVQKSPFVVERFME